MHESSSHLSKPSSPSALERSRLPREVVLEGYGRPSRPQDPNLPSTSRKNSPSPNLLLIGLWPVVSLGEFLEVEEESKRSRLRLLSSFSGSLVWSSSSTSLCSFSSQVFYPIIGSATDRESEGRVIVAEPRIERPLTMKDQGTLTKKHSGRVRKSPWNLECFF